MHALQESVGSRAGHVGPGSGVTGQIQAGRILSARAEGSMDSGERRRHPRGEAALSSRSPACGLGCAHSCSHDHLQENHLRGLGRLLAPGHRPVCSVSLGSRPGNKDFNTFPG